MRKLRLEMKREVGEKGSLYLSGHKRGIRGRAKPVI